MVGYVPPNEAGSSPINVWVEGTNDSVLLPNTRHIPLSTFESNMDYFLTSLTSSSSPYAVAHSNKPVSIILITPPPLCPVDRLDPSKPPVRSYDRQKEFRDAVVRIGDQWQRRLGKGGRHEIVLIDLWDCVTRTAGGEGLELKPYFL